MYWIELNIARCRQQMTFIQNTRAEPTLEQVPMYVLRKVFPARIPAVGFAYRSGEIIRVFGHHNQVDVVGHQTPRQNLNAEAIQLLGEHVKIYTAILIGTEDW